jgi:chromosome partitioning protein
MAHIICIANQKGGVGKTTTAINLAASLAVSERRTLIVDCDPQGNATTGVGIDKSAVSGSLYQGLIGESAPEALIVDTEIDALKIIPALVDLIGFDVEMMTARNREMALKDLLAAIEDRFDYILIDCPPSLSLLTVNAMSAARSLLIPLQCEFYALEGLGQLIQTMNRIKSALNPQLGICGIVLTMFDKRTNLSYQVAEEAEKYFRDLVYETTVPRNVRLGEAPSFGKPILLYDVNSAGAESYFNLAKEVIQTHENSVPAASAAAG